MKQTSIKIMAGTTKLVGTEDEQACDGDEDTDDRGAMVVLLHPVLNENRDEHGRHDKVEAAAC